MLKCDSALRIQSNYVSYFFEGVVPAISHMNIIEVGEEGYAAVASYSVSVKQHEGERDVAGRIHLIYRISHSSQQEKPDHSTSIDREN